MNTNEKENFRAQHDLYLGAVIAAELKHLQDRDLLIAAANRLMLVYDTLSLLIEATPKKETQS